VRRTPWRRAGRAESSKGNATSGVPITSEASRRVPGDSASRLLWGIYWGNSHCIAEFATSVCLGHVCGQGFAPLDTVGFSAHRSKGCRDEG
jgi:hypothetical protein